MTGRLASNRVSIDPHVRKAFVDDVRVRLTARQYAALELLMLANGEPVSRKRITEEALGRPLSPHDDRAADQLIFLLRRVLPRDPDGEFCIRSWPLRGWWIAKRTDPDQALAA